ncbi:MAG: dolichol monophosphate mannose synthase [Roseateles depolymerans]|uniref:Dolichol monophosphate mannose synthase n=1 Tax=Roseateles depolymerans TaxID=76731 RepID=A0A2W5DXE9_9BURK|nr:MAG: dolichol monophosphate mannose synthase [Roseateles depolymerans]
MNATSSGAPTLSIVIPTFNERGNVEELISRIDACMGDASWEVIYVDDNSPDGTATAVRELAARDGRVRLVHRVGRRGLSSACIEGMLASTSPYLAVMDADLQHDERLLPAMLQALRSEGLDIVVGSRHADGGSLGNWDADRARISDMATRLAKLVTKADLRDPMSGFFMLRREVLYEAMPRLSAIGFKILLDLFASVQRPLRFKELGYTFRNRFSGESKLDSLVAWEYLMMLADKRLGHIVPVRFIPFALIGGAGVVVHMIVLWTMFKLMGQSFAAGQTLATLIAMTVNFFFNNGFTYRDRRLKGWGLLRGWLSFTIACSLGAVANVGIATYLFRENTADWALAALSGIVVGAVWNYAVTSVYTWGKPKQG